MAEAKQTRRVAFVTGASYGIGAACALALARDGFDVAVAATKAENVAKTCANLKSAGARSLAIGLDVRSVESVNAGFKRVIEELGAIDVLVNNAGVPVNK